uniref:Uncharacterized protein n=1 Tax=Vibrio parahaemolyticus TaxID=670 RepID=W0NR05_VIBPH|nr:hypothetical protein [Vibrio parahaemolyticus]
MKVNPYISSSMSAPLSGTENHVGNQAVEESVKNLDKALLLLDSAPSCNADLKTLSDTVNNQRSALDLISSRNAEVDIANSLQDSIDDYAKELDLSGCGSTGGIKVGSMLRIDKIASIIYLTNHRLVSEDLFQVALIDVLINSMDYGLESWMQILCSISLGSIEYIGQVSIILGLDEPSVEEVNNHGINNGNLKKSRKCMGKNSNGAIPDRLAYRAMLKISGEWPNLQDLTNIGSKLDKDNYFNAKVVAGITTTNNNMSPMMRLMLLTQALESDDDLSKAELETILTGTLQEVKILQTQNFKSIRTEYILGNCPICRILWNILELGANTPSGRRHNLGLLRASLNQQYLTSLYQNHPSRVLVDDEITDINRIGDTVKMIQQTLKYWIQIMRDERMAVARNI